MVNDVEEPSSLWMIFKKGEKEGKVKNESLKWVTNSGG